MKKLFFFIPALLLSLLANAAVININTGTTDALRVALDNASDGDEIIMAAGTYEESNSNYIAFNAKNVIVKAAEGANVIIKPHVPFTVSGGARAEIKGVKIDASELCSLGSYSHLMYASDNSDNNRLILDGCEVYGYTVGNAVIACRSSYKLDSLIINNCKFYNHTTRSCVFLENTENKGLIVTNSTFYNIATGTESFGASIIDDRNSAAKVRVDHCTFYNVVAQNTDYAAVGKLAISDGIVSNSIFAMPTSTDGLRAIRGVAQANNCLTYNYTYDSNWGIHSSVTKNNCIQLQDPLFTNAAESDFTLEEASPAVDAGTDGKTLGDPRWWPVIVLPETDFATPYVCDPADAKTSGRIALTEGNLVWNNNEDATLNGVATWKINVTRACYVSVTVTELTANGHCYSVTLLDADGDPVGEPVAEAANTWKSGDLALGTLIIPAPGEYTFKLANSTGWSTAAVSGLTLSYIGGAVQNMPGTTAIAEAWFSAEGTRADGKIDFPDRTIQDGWVKWNVAFASAANYNVIVNIDNANGHNYTVALYEDEDDASPIVLSEGTQKSTIGTLEMGTMEVPAGNYILQVTNAVQWSDAQLISVQFVYAGGGTIDIPGSIALSEAILSTRAYMDGDDLHFTDAEHLGHISEEYAKWNINVAADGIFTFTANCNATSWSHLKISILDSDENELYTHQTEYSFNTATAVVTPEWFLEAGNYILKAENPADWSDGYLTSLSAAQVANILIVDENATDMAYINEKNGLSMKPLLKRSFRSGMFNTVCFPFNGVTAGELESIFGAGYVLLEMSSATLADNVLTLNFSNVDLSGATYGRPYLIKPTQDVVNPLFNSHTIYKSTSHLVAAGANANFVGSFIKGTVPAGEDNLFLGANDLLYFSEDATTIKGMRAYFQIHDVPSGAPIRQARIVEQGNVVTALEFVNGEWQEVKSANGTIKTIENGQLILIRDGKRYNVMGVRF